MRKVALRGLLARKTRLALTAMAVALGVTLIAGTYVFTDTINRSFDRIFAEAYRGIDVVVTPNDEIETADGVSPPMDAQVLERLRSVPGVDRAEGEVFDGSGVILGDDGAPISTTGAPQFIASATADERFRAFEASEGRVPSAAGEVALDKATAEREGFAVGDRVGLQGDAGRKDYTLVGVVQVAGVDSFGGASVALLTLPEAQRMTGKVGQFDQIDLAATPGTSPEQLRAAARAELGSAVGSQDHARAVEHLAFRTVDAGHGGQAVQDPRVHRRRHAVGRLDLVVRRDDHVDAAVGRGEDPVEGPVDGVREDVGAGDERDAERHGQRRQREPGLAGEQPAQRDLAHAVRPPARRSPRRRRCGRR